MILLINPGGIPIGANEATVIPPVGLLYIAEVLHEHDIECSVYDAHFSGISPDEVLSIVKDVNPQVVGFRVYYYNINWSKQCIQKIRQRKPDIVFGIGGHIASYSPERIIDMLEADFAIVGEGEMPMLKLADNINRGEVYYKEVPGIFARLEDGLYYKGPINNRITALDDLPFPNYDLVGGLDKYSSRSRYSPVAPLFMTRGCAFNCSFCSKHVFHNRVTFRSPDNVIEEIKLLKSKYAIKQVSILDDNCTVNKRYINSVLDGIIQEKLDLKFDIRAGVRVESLDESMLKKMREAGFYKISFGIESADERILQLCNKQMDLAKLKEMALCAKRVGFQVFGFFIIGLPGETWDSLKRTLGFAKRLHLDVANFCMATPFPGTALYDYVKKHGEFLFDPEGHYDFGFYGHKVFYTLPGLDEAQILRMYKYAYKSFYTLPKILSNICKIRSLGELKWFLGAGASILKGKL